ncbi:hypothetical protein [Phenylobacterium sp.]|nr:hypothetical protein [Phenylobacterium sp.]MDP1616734.1 hypothetical protein [Phenylobacterium sp.]MDP1985714.1 hypothetical protein [Phenylobacterium sp.]
MAQTAPHTTASRTKSVQDNHWTALETLAFTAAASGLLWLAIIGILA